MIIILIVFLRLLIFVLTYIIKILALNFKVEGKVQKLIDKITTLNSVPIDLHLTLLFQHFIILFLNTVF